MQWVAELRWYLTIIQIGAYPLLLIKLFTSGLTGKYQYFCWYIAFESVRVPLMWSLPFRSSTYAHLYFGTQPLIWFFYVVVVLEIFQLVLRNHAGIASLGRKTLKWSLIASGLISGATLLFQLQNKSTESAVLFNFALLERLVMTSLLVLLLCLIAFLSYFPVPLTRNVRVHAMVFATYFAARTVLFWVRTWFGEQAGPALNMVGAALAVGCLFSWILLLSRAGEGVAEQRRPATESEARLLAQLDALNDTLLGSSKK